MQRKIKSKYSVYRKCLQTSNNSIIKNLSKTKMESNKRYNLLAFRFKTISQFNPFVR
jgi:hypothetical protein